MSLDSMRLLLEEALGCTFQEGNYHKIPALTTELLGMKVVLFDWCGLNQTEIFRLQGFVDDERFLDGLGEDEDIEVVRNDISQAIVDLLGVRGAGEWRIPSDADIKAESDHGKAIAHRFRS